MDLSSPENIISNSLDVERLANFEVETAYHTVAIMFIAIKHFFLKVMVSLSRILMHHGEVILLLLCHRVVITLYRDHMS